TKNIAGRFELRTDIFPMPAANGGLPAGGNAAMIFTKDRARQQTAWEYVKFATGPIGQSIVAQNSGYMPSNTLAVADPPLLGPAYRNDPNRMTNIRQLPSITPFFSFPGKNAIKITDVIRNHLRSVVTQQRTPEVVLPEMVRDVRTLLSTN